MTKWDDVWRQYEGIRQQVGRKSVDYLSLTTMEVIEAIVKRNTIEPKLVELDQNMMRKIDFFAGQILASLVETNSKYSEVELAKIAVKAAQALIEELRE